MEAFANRHHLWHTGDKKISILATTTNNDNIHCSLIIVERLNSSNDHITSVERDLEVNYLCHIHENSWYIHTSGGLSGKVFVR